MATEKVKNTIVNFGPQHPSSHGVLRIVLELNGEVVERAEPIIGQLHRGTEKLMEDKTYMQNIPYFDRLDYVAPLNYEHTWVLAAEKLLQLDVPKRAQYIRVLFLELSRINKHLLCLAAQALDCGAMTPTMWGYELREQIMDFFEEISGGRLHMNYFRVGGVTTDTSPEFLKRVSQWADSFEPKFKDMCNLITNNRIFKQRTVDIGIISKEQALDFAFSGSNLRASGIAWDLRKAESYEVYSELDFDIPIGSNGDCYDRYLVRILEVYESLKLVKQCIKNMPQGLHLLDNYKFTAPKRADMKESMEAMIHHFKLFSQGFSVPAGQVYVATETPSGEFGVFLVSQGGNKPYRAHLRSNGLAHLFCLPSIMPNHQLSDLAAILGSLDLVLGEIDR